MSHERSSWCQSALRLNESRTPAERQLQHNRTEQQPGTCRCTESISTFKSRHRGLELEEAERVALFVVLAQRMHSISEESTLLEHVHLWGWHINQRDEAVNRLRAGRRGPRARRQTWQSVSGGSLRGLMSEEQGGGSGGGSVRRVGAAALKRTKEKELASVSTSCFCPRYE